jgi:hypothetical protein
MNRRYLQLKSKRGLRKESTLGEGEKEEANNVESREEVEEKKTEKKTEPNERVKSGATLFVLHQKIQTYRKKNNHAGC